ncbi:MAG: 23S rRNA (adenine(2503)-C(2))-methyltransferase RlmN [Culturomica sp.]|jgi:23S rRNA (adenine2503-C2)-methyltransferase|nr:23S rRNA (adenine(2503)-C(2))-methyltransferase RlmN [Culturomica sp.]
MANEFNIRNISEENLADFLKQHCQQSFRAKQIMQWIWQKGVTSFEDMTNLPKQLRDLLNEKFYFDGLREAHSEISNDTTNKTLWQLYDGEHVESVLIPSKDRYTVCVSSQVGCKLGCKFCATATLGFKRNLNRGEIFEQVFRASNEAQKRNGNLSNIVFMGMGEPLLNYENVLQAIDRITSPQGLGMSPARITLSTAGIVEGIKKLADDKVRFNLAVSLHSAKDEIRSHLMPVNRMSNLHDLAESLKYFVNKTDSRPTFEYLLLKGVNDSLSDAVALAAYCRQFPVKVNIIEYNESPQSSYNASTEKDRDTFVSYLENKNMIVNIRRSKGKDIAAACGQLANRFS